MSGSPHNAKCQWLCRWRTILTTTIVLTLGLSGRSAAAAAPPNLDAANQRLLMHEKTDQFRALADQQRYVLLQQAVALHEKEKQQATEELTRMAVMRDRIEHLRNAAGLGFGELV